MSHKTSTVKYHAMVDEKCRQIRRRWSESERKLRELRASLAQSRLALCLLRLDQTAGSY